MGYHPGGQKESDTTERLHFHFLHCLVLGENMVAQVVKISACHAGDLGLIPGSGRPPGGGHDNPLQYSRLENSMDRGAWWATVHEVSESQTRLSGFHLHLLIEYGFPGGTSGKERESESEVAQSCLTLCDPMDCSLPGSSIHGIF